jgi:hypothetical protein
MQIGDRLWDSIISSAVHGNRVGVETLVNCTILTG